MAEKQRHLSSRPFSNRKARKGENFDGSQFSERSRLAGPNVANNFQVGSLRLLFQIMGVSSSKGVCSLHNVVGLREKCSRSEALVQSTDSEAIQRCADVG